ncbi:gliding motility-associated C-terminal domain-containing protein [Winogradskyella marincola]|uniref:Gliding motility-associated C-terminal domain-containing protein n=1 Tax=Winogradskyella marincola TaxID=3037795 RepID=A0ABT6G2U6_9FLAO|nr:gliding motility-associated C-terminal domain-containing protein [Winogradskyella sp. YYF002]MDG4716366.1 gliding motility-associated C-terminal domain-containing protein [Winogradskyella sp. YYF002]
MSLVLPLSAQDISLFEQFNGRYDYTAIGNTLNQAENNIDQSFCSLLESSSANLTLDADNQIVKAYLYWAGSGFGDTEVTLNGIQISSEETYNVTYTDTASGQLNYFSCYADITNLILSEGNGTYTFSDMDISADLMSNPGYCSNRTNFGGWSIYVIYQNETLPLNQVNLYQGLEIINRNVQEKEIILDNIDVIDNVGAKIGFLAWEGDNNLNYGESLSINNNVISNPPLNLADNAFNGTNTFTNSTTFYNADLDVYDLENNINIGDTSVSIKLTTGGINENGGFSADLIILNNIITVLNSQLPDATIEVNDYTVNCGDNSIELFYTVNNFNSTDVLPANTPIAFYLDGLLVGQSQTTNSLNIGESETNSTIVTIPEDSNQSITIVAAVDDDGSMSGVVTETNEDNNINFIDIELLVIPDITTLPGLMGCNEGFETSTYNLYNALESIEYEEENISFYTSLEDLETASNPILVPSIYNNTTNPETIYARLESPPCYEVYQFQLSVENCPPYVPNGFSPNDDNYNDWFNIQGLYDVFTEHQLKIYNRYGDVIFEGNNDKPWFGKINRGLNNHGQTVPVGTYFYVLHLNDPNYRPMVGWVYVNY